MSAFREKKNNLDENLKYVKNINKGKDKKFFVSFSNFSLIKNYKMQNIWIFKIFKFDLNGSLNFH